MRTGSVDKSRRFKSTSMVAAHLGLRREPYHQALESFRRRVRRVTGAQLNLVLLAEGEAGDEPAMLKKLATGELGLAILSGSGLGARIPPVLVFDLPYLFKGRRVALATADRMRTCLKRHFRKGGLELLSVLDGGVRHIFNARRPVRHPYDVEGLRLRSMANPIHQATLRSLGARPVPLSTNDTLAALERGEIDGGERSPTNLLEGGWYVIARHYALTMHVVAVTYFVADAEHFDSLEPGQRELLRMLARELEHFERGLYARRDRFALAELRQRGVSVTRPRLAPFAEQTASVWKQSADVVGGFEWIQQVRLASESVN